MIKRQDRIASEVRKVLSTRLLKTPAILTILKVKLNSDLSVAKIYFSLFGSNLQCDETLKFLDIERKNLRKEVGNRLKLRITPELKWVQDDSVKHADEINCLLNSIISKQ